MAKDIHPEYFPKAKASCACGTVYHVGSTKNEIQVDICANCHPFYTGETKLIDTAGRVEKFKKRRTKAEATSKVRNKKTKLAEKKVKRETKKKEV